MYYLIIVLQILGVICIFADMMYLSTRPPCRMQTHLMVLMFTTILMMVGYLIEIKASNFDTAYVGICLGYLGKPFAMLSYTLFIAEYCGIKISERMTCILTSYMSLFPIIVFSNEFHHLYYSTVAFDRTRTFSPILKGHGILYYLYMGTILVLTFIDVYLVVREYVTARTKAEKKQAILIIAVVAACILGYIVYFTGITNSYDSTMLGCFIGTIILSWLFFRYKLYDVLNILRNKALEETTSGVMALDNKDNVIYSNRSADEIIEKYISLNEIKKLNDGENIIFSGDSVFSVRKETVLNKGLSYGASIEIEDITKPYNYQSELEKNVSKRTEEVRHIQRSIISSFGNIVEARDLETGDHIRRTSEYVENTALKLKKKGLFPDILTSEYIECLTSVAPLHDIGKISIPDHILLKPGRLTDEEFNIMKTHTTIGYQIIERTMKGVESEDYVELAQEVALYHHERWDGSGYPGSLREDAIPLAARIMAVADVFDALVSQRCYKKAMPYDVAIDVIKKSSGSHFDPRIVDAFLEYIEDNQE